MSTLSIVVLLHTSIVIAATTGQQTTRCPNVVAQLGNPAALDTDSFDVYVDGEDLGNELSSQLPSPELPLITGGNVNTVVSSLESLQQFTLVFSALILPSSLMPIPIRLRVGANASRELYYSMSVWPVNETMAPPGCPEPNQGILFPGEVLVVNVSLSCYLDGVVYYQVCLTLGNEPVDALNGTYTIYEFYFARMCQSDIEKMCSITPQSSVETMGFCLTYNQTLSLVRSQEGTWRLLVAAFSDTEYTDGISGYCMINPDRSNIVDTLSDPDIASTLPIAEMFTYLDTYINRLNFTSPVVYSLGFSVAEPAVLGTPFAEEGAQGIVYDEFNFITVQFPCLQPGYTQVALMLNTTVVIEGTLYRRDYSLFVYKNCTPANFTFCYNETSSTSHSVNLGIVIGVPLGLVSLVASLSLVLCLLVVGLTWKQHKTKHSLIRSTQLELAVCNAYTPRKHSPFAFLEQYNVEYNYSSIEVLEELGEGAFGRVFKARAPGIMVTESACGEFVAVKTLKEDAEKDLLEEFCEEVQTCIQFDHKNIIRLVGVCSQSVQKCMIFEYMDLGSLDELLRKSDPHNPSCDGDQTVKITPQLFMHCVLMVAEGATYLASLKFVHRDIAARNCLVDHNLCVKIADFGMSRKVNQMDYYRIGSTAACLPIRWMPPEALLFGKFTHKSDVWSFGVLMWEVYTFGRQPYGGSSNYEVIDKIKSGQILACPDSCAASVYDIMKSCWTRSPSARPTMEHVTQRIKCLMQGSGAIINESGEASQQNTMYVNLEYVEETVMEDVQ